MHLCFVYGLTSNQFHPNFYIQWKTFPITREGIINWVAWPTCIQISGVEERGHLASFRCIPIHLSFDATTVLLGGCGKLSCLSFLNEAACRGDVEKSWPLSSGPMFCSRWQSSTSPGRATSYWRSWAFTWQVNCSQLWESPVTKCDWGFAMAWGHLSLWTFSFMFLCF